MKPTLKDGDGLYLLPCEDRILTVGDLVVFKSPESGLRVVHRIVTLGKEGIRTRGDNNSFMDPFILQLSDIEGTVIYIKRGNRQLAPQDLSTVRKKQYVNRMLMRFALPFRPVYRFLSFINPVKFKIRIVTFKKAAGSDQVMYWHSLLIARRPAGEDKWRVRVPFRLFIKRRELR
ncbi:hypothetical protein JW935_01880 [candidate division KSB1 bacterium]|nr:hypothetical protein [candidate division KSB1 bacterium]